MRRSNKVPAGLNEISGAAEAIIIDVQMTSTAVVMSGLRRTTNNTNLVGMYEATQTTVVTGGLRRSNKVSNLLDQEEKTASANSPPTTEPIAKQTTKKATTQKTDLKKVLSGNKKAQKLLDASKAQLVQDQHARFRHSGPIVIPAKTDISVLYHSAGNLPRVHSEGDSDEDIFGRKKPQVQYYNFSNSESYSDDEGLVIKL